MKEGADTWAPFFFGNTFTLSELYIYAGSNHQQNNISERIFYSKIKLNTANVSH